MIRLPLHPILVAMVPIVSMYAASPGLSRPGEVAHAALVTAAAAAVLLAVAGLVYRDLRKAALFVSVLLLVFFSFESLYVHVEDWTIGGFRPGRRRYILPLAYVALAAFGVWLYRRRGTFAVSTALANVLAIGALLQPVVVFGTTAARLAMRRAEDPAPPPVGAARQPAQTPDIYYVVFDRYGDEHTLRASGIDPAPFQAWLRDRGFFVARESRSNYLKTILSLASSLNMSYLDAIAATEGAASGNWLPVYGWARDHQVGKFLRSRGYEYIHLGSWYWPTRANPHATRNVNYYDTVPRPVMQLLDNVFFEPVQRLGGPLLDQRQQQWHRVTRQVEDLLALVPEPGPKFVFFHVLVPHHPHVFEPDGGFVTLDEESRRTREQNYANQVRAANGMIQRMVDRILSASPEPPVIIVQGDEGPYPRGTESAHFDWSRAGRDDLLVKSGILNAYYLPCAPPGALYPAITPVNTFRVVFNHCLGTTLPLVPDRVYRHASDVRPYSFHDITDLLREAPATAAVRTSVP